MVGTKFEQTLVEMLAEPRDTRTQGDGVEYSRGYSDGCLVRERGQLMDVSVEQNPLKVMSGVESDLSITPAVDIFPLGSIDSAAQAMLDVGTR